MSEVACPHCRGAMNSPPELAGKWVACPLCHQQFILPDPSKMQLVAPPQNPYANPYAYAQPYAGEAAAYVEGPYGPVPPGDWLSGIRVPVLISAILNLIFALVWALTCFGLILTVPLIILCVFEFLYYANAPAMPPQKAVSDGKTLGIIEIVSGLFSANVFTLICGILALVNAGQAESRLRFGR